MHTCIIYSYHLGGGGREESGDIYLLCKNTCTCRFSEKFCFLFLVLHVLVCGMHDKLTVICVGHRETGGAERKHWRIETEGESL